MTLITNEIHLLDGFNRTMLVFAADRRISKPDGSFHSLQRKLFKIPHLSGGISYFGLATIGHKCLSDWLATFIRRSAHLGTLKDFSCELRDQLNKVMPPKTLEVHHSGFHICGYNQEGVPEFWFLTNIGGVDSFCYTNLQSKYSPPSPDFLGRDAITFGWDGTNISSVAHKTGVQIYRNGDFRAHVAAWERLDQMFKDLLSFPDFKGLKTPEDYSHWIKFKIGFISRFYKAFAKHHWIGGPIDVFVDSRTL